MVPPPIPTTRHRYSYQDYLRFEAAANVRHEFFAGEIYAMAGGTPEHAALAAKVIALLDFQLRGRPCRVYSSDLRVRVVETGLATYPDVTVICGPIERDVEDRDAVTNPTLLVEVLSPSTEDYDRGEKLTQYRRIPDLRAIILMSHREVMLEVHRRVADGSWVSERFGAGQTVQIEPINSVLNVDELYQDAFGNLRP